MNVTIPVSELASALKGLSGVAPRNPSLRVLAHVRIAKTEQGVTVTATNLDQWLACDCPKAVVEGGCELLVSLSALAEIVKTADRSGNVGITDHPEGKAKASVMIKGVPVERLIDAMPPADWPAPPEPPKEWKPAAPELFEAIRKVAPSASRREAETKAVRGILLEPGMVVATDRTELAIVDIDTGVQESVILPVSKPLLNGIFGEGGSMAASKPGGVRHVHFRSGRWTLTMKAVDENYLNYRQVIPRPESLTETVTLDDDDMATLPKVLAACEGKDGRGGVVILDADDKGVRLLSGRPGDDTVIPTKAVHKGGEGRMIPLAVDKLQRIISLGLRELRLSPTGYNPVLAANPGSSVRFVFLPMRMSVPVKTSVHKQVTTTTIKEMAMTQEIERKTAAQATQPAAQVAAKPETKPEATPQAGANGLRVIGQPVPQAADDPFEQLIQAVAGVRASARITLDTASQLLNKIRDAQRAVKGKEREFKSTKDLIEKLRTASGF